MDPYDDRRAHLVKLGATDEIIQQWANEAVDLGQPVGAYLEQIEQHLRRNDYCVTPARWWKFGEAFQRGPHPSNRSPR